MCPQSLPLGALLLALQGHRALVSALVLQGHGATDPHAPPPAPGDILEVGDAVGIPKGTGLCTEGLLHAWDGRGLASIADCIKLCSLERDCGYVSFCSPLVPQCAGPKLKGTCSRFARNASCGPLRALVTRGSSSYHTSYEVQPKNKPPVEEAKAEALPAVPTKRPFPEDIPVWPSPAPPAVSRADDASNATENESLAPAKEKEIFYRPPVAPKPEAPEELEEGMPSEDNVTDSDPSEVSAEEAPVREKEDGTSDGDEAKASGAEPGEEAEAPAAGGGEEQPPVPDWQATGASQIEKQIDTWQHKKNAADDEGERALTKQEKRAYEKAKQKQQADEQKAIEKRNKLEQKKQKDIAKKEEEWRKEAEKRAEKEKKQKEKEEEKKQKEKAKAKAAKASGKATSKSSKELKGKGSAKEVAKGAKPPKAPMAAQNKAKPMPAKKAQVGGAVGAAGADAEEGPVRSPQKSQREIIDEQKEIRRREEEEAAEENFKAMHGS